MEFLTFNLRAFKGLFYAILIVNIAVTAAAFLTGANVLGVVLLPENMLFLTRHLLTLLVVAAVLQTVYQRKLIKKLDEIPAYEDKVAHYMKLYKLRLYWKCGSCLISCLIHLLTGRNIFLYFAVFDVLTTWMYFPNKMLISKELKSDEVVFIQE
jgi:hypothetical protein